MKRVIPPIPKQVAYVCDRCDCEAREWDAKIEFAHFGPSEQHLCRLCAADLSDWMNVSPYTQIDEDGNASNEVTA